eukprot:200147-Chlamydomonas_euryale.AAC.2
MAACMRGPLRRNIAVPSGGMGVEGRSHPCAPHPTPRAGCSRIKFDGLSHLVVAHNPHPRRARSCGPPSRSTACRASSRCAAESSIRSRARERVRCSPLVHPHTGCSGELTWTPRGMLGRADVDAMRVSGHRSPPGVW